jgi:hypothetical protein
MNQQNEQTAAELEALKDCPEALAGAKVVGAWIWIEFPAKPGELTRDFLKARGYRWNRTRACWQHPCGHHTRAARGYDPRQKYGAVAAARFVTPRELEA